MIKICLECGRPGFTPWVGKISWRREWLPTPVFLPGESHGQRTLAGYSPWGCRVGHNWETSTFTHLGLYIQKVGKLDLTCQAPNHRVSSISMDRFLSGYVYRFMCLHVCMTLRSKARGPWVWQCTLSLQLKYTLSLWPWALFPYRGISGWCLSISLAEYWAGGGLGAMR